MDSVDSLLKDLRLEIRRVRKLRGGTLDLFGTRKDSAGDPWFAMLCQIVGEGLVMGGSTMHSLQPGDVLLIRHDGHNPPGIAPPLAICSPPGGTAQTGPAVEPSTLRTLMVVGTLRLDGDPSHPLLQGLPAAFIARDADISGQSRVGHPAFLIDQLPVLEDEENSPMILRLFEVLAMKAMKAYYHAAGADYRFMHALSHPQIGPAIAAMHSHPGFHWTIDRLAERVGLSRSVFCERFTKLTGIPAMRYLTTWRMQLAMDKLRKGHNDLAAVAQHIGYRSPTAFQKAFKRVHGVTPLEAARS